MAIRWGALFLGAVIGAGVAILFTGKATGDGALPPTDQYKKAGWSNG